MRADTIHRCQAGHILTLRYSNSAWDWRPLRDGPCPLRYCRFHHENWQLLRSSAVETGRMMIKKVKTAA